MDEDDSIEPGVEESTVETTTGDGDDDDDESDELEEQFVEDDEGESNDSAGVFYSQG